MDNLEKEAEKVLNELQNKEAETSQIDIQDEGLQRQIDYFSQLDPKFKESQEYKDLIASTSGQAPSSEDDEDLEEEDLEEENSEEEDDESDVFGLSKSSKKNKEVKVDFEVPKQMKSLVKSKYGIEDVDKFFGSVDTWRNQAQEKAELQKSYDTLLDDLGSMPKEIKDVVNAWANGDDFTSYFQPNQRLNYDESFEKQDANRLVQHYLKDEYDELQDDLDAGDISQAEYDKQLRLLSRTTKRFFNEEKNSIEKERERIEATEKSRFQAVKQSATLSVDSLTSKYPNFSKNELGKIRSTLIEGKIEDLFLNEDGTYNEEAAERLAYALYGNKIVDSAKGKAKRQGESEANMKIVDSSAKTIRKQKSSQGNDRPDLSAVSHLTGMSAFKNDPYV
jgi:hypothetical protein